jgi:hypothetical protein
VLKGGSELRVFFLFFFRDGLTEFAGVFSAKSHLDCLGQWHHFGIFPDHVGPRDTLQDRPLTAARKGKCDENHEKGKAAHGRLIE